MISKQKTIIFTVIVWVIAFVLIEVGAGFIAGNAYMAMDVIDDFSQHQSYGYFQPNHERTILFPGLDPYSVKVNDLGLRSTGEDHTFNSIQNKTRVLCLGDSHTFGLFADDEESYPYILQQKLNAAGATAAVLNAGLGGTAVQDVLYYMQVKGLALDPDYVIVNISANDFDDIRRDIPSYEEIKQERVTGFKKTFKQSNFGRAFRKMYVHFKYQRFLKKVEDPRLFDILKNQSKSLDDLLYVARDYETPLIVRDLLGEETRELVMKYFAKFEELAELLRERDIPLIVLMHPEVLKVYEYYPKEDFYSILKERFEMYDVTLVDVVPAFKEYKGDIMSLYLNPPRDFHLSKSGNNIVADALLKYLPKE